MIDRILTCLVLFLSSCTGVKEVFVNSETGEKIIGYGRDCKYRIGKTKRSDFTDEMLKVLEKDSIFLYFNDVRFPPLIVYPPLPPEKRLVAGTCSGKYVPRKGLKGGDSIEKAIQLYGKPVATDLLYWEDSEHGVRWSWEGLFYKNMAILIDTSNNRTRGVPVIGRQFPIDKKYRRKSSWYNPK